MVVSEVKALATQTAKATREIVRNVDQAATGTNSVTTHITDVAKTADETGEAAGQVLHASSALTEQAKHLECQMQPFLASIRAVSLSKGLVRQLQGNQFTGMEWASFLKHPDLQPSMSRRGNCHDNAVAESFFNLIRREHIRRKVYRRRDEARRDVTDSSEIFDHPTRKHARNRMLSPVEFERQQMRVG